MPRQNRVLPTGEIVADPAKGDFTGNRGILHDAEGRLGAARWRHPHWIVCVLVLPGRPKRQLMAPGRWTELFFLDEAVALAAGHRPCAYCRREAYEDFRAAWVRAGQPGGRAPGIDAALHAARVGRDRRQIRHAAPWSSLPEGAFALLDGRPALVRTDAVLPYSPGGYGTPLTLPDGIAEVLTPAPTVAALAAGYRPALHRSAG